MDIPLFLERQRQGFFNLHETAKMLNLNYQTLRQNVRRGDVPRPAHQIGQRYYYSVSDVERLAGIFASRRRYKEYQRQ